MEDRSNAPAGWLILADKTARIHHDVLRNFIVSGVVGDPDAVGPWRHVKSPVFAAR